GLCHCVVKRRCSKARSPESSLTSALSVFSSTNGEVWAESPGAHAAAAPTAKRMETNPRILALLFRKSVNRQDDQGAVVARGARARVGGQGGEDHVAKTRSARAGLGAQKSFHALEPERLPGRVRRLDEAVGQENQPVAGVERDLAHREVLLFGEPERE